jgi:uncharacterized membrane protein
MEEIMSEFLAVEFDDRYKADALLFSVSELKKSAYLDFEGSAMISKNDFGKVEVDKSFDMAAQYSLAGTLYFGFFVAVVGWILTGGSLGGVLMGFQVGALFGWISGAIASHYSEFNFSDNYISDLTGRVKPGYTAVALVLRDGNPLGQIQQEVQRLGGSIIDIKVAA